MSFNLSLVKFCHEMYELKITLLDGSLKLFNNKMLYINIFKNLNKFFIYKCINYTGPIIK